MGVGTDLRIGLLTGSVSRKGGGVFDAIRGLALALNKHRGIELHVFGLADEATAEDEHAWDDIPVHAASIAGPRAFGYAGDMFRAISSSRLDILHIACTWMYPSLVSLRWIRENGRPVVVSPHGDLDPWALANSRWKKEIAGMLFERRHLQRAACLHALCASEAHAFRAYGLKNPICVIPNGVSLPEMNGIDRAAPWTGDVPSEDKVLLSLGRLHPKKNIMALIEGWTAVCQSEGAAQDWWLAIAGWDQLGYEAECKQLAAQVRDSRVLFVGPQHASAKDACFRSASAFVLPSLSEGLPLAVLEAWSHRLPVLMTPECNLPEGAQSGAAIEIGKSVAAISRGLQQLFRMSRADLTLMGTTGRRLVEEHFMWSRVADEMLAVYRWLCEGGVPPRSVISAGA